LTCKSDGPGYNNGLCTIDITAAASAAVTAGTHNTTTHHHERRKCAAFTSHAAVAQVTGVRRHHPAVNTRTLWCRGNNVTRQVRHRAAQSVAFNQDRATVYNCLRRQCCRHHMAALCCPTGSTFQHQPRPTYNSATQSHTQLGHDHQVLQYCVVWAEMQPDVTPLQRICQRCFEQRTTSGRSMVGEVEGGAEVLMRVSCPAPPNKSAFTPAANAIASQHTPTPAPTRTTMLGVVHTHTGGQAQQTGAMAGSAPALLLRRGPKN
jgi:hypothetical protein